MAIADVYNALISRRPYKPPSPPAEAALKISEGAGSHFDPATVAAFVRQRGEFERIAADHADPPEAVDVADVADTANAANAASAANAADSAGVASADRRQRAA